MQSKEIISTIFVHGAQDSSSFILLYMNIPKYSKLFIQIVRETSVTRFTSLLRVQLR